MRRPEHRGVAVAVWHEDRVLLARNSYRRWLTLPGGFVRRGEDFETAGLRELREETGIGLPAGSLAFVGIFFHATEHLRDHVHVYEARLSKEPELAIDNREVVWASFMDPESALERELLPPVREYLSRGRAGRE